MPTDVTRGTGGDLRPRKLLSPKGRSHLHSAAVRGEEVEVADAAWLESGDHAGGRVSLMPEGEALDVSTESGPRLPCPWGS